MFAKGTSISISSKSSSKRAPNTVTHFSMEIHLRVESLSRKEFLVNGKNSNRHATKLHFSTPVISAFPIKVCPKMWRWRVLLAKLMHDKVCQTNHSWIKLNENFFKWKLLSCRTWELYIYFSYDVHVDLSILISSTSFKLSCSGYWEHESENGSAGIETEIAPDEYKAYTE